MTEEAQTEVAETEVNGAPEIVAEPAAKTAEADTVQDDEGKAKASPEVADEEDADPAGEETEDDDKPKKRLSRAARLQRKIAAQALELDELRAAKQRDSVQAEQPPKEADFHGDYEAYNRALIAFEVTKSLRAESAERAIEGTKAQREAMKRELLEDHMERADEFRKVVPDFDDVVAKGLNVPMHDDILDLLVESPKGPMLAYHLAKNPALVKEIASLSPVAAAARIGEISARLSLPNPKKQTQAPAPAAPIKGGAAPSVDLAKLDMASYIAARNAKQA